MKKTMIELERIGFDLKQRRTELKITQREVAKACGISIVSLQNWESGITKQIPEDRYTKLRLFFLEKAKKANQEE